jgi:aspartyl-tRNA(Asn)/glutamyl-tRNA(Gln) amidotransferase subunit A
MYKTIAEIQSALTSGTTTVRTLVEAYLSNIEKNKHLNAFLEVWSDEALQLADQLDQKTSAKGKLYGLVIGLKDNICYAGHKVSAGSKILEGFTSIYSATVVERLLAEDAIIIGRLNCDEFAMGSSNENSAYGLVLNPLDNSRVPGGSSGGSAAAVAADLCHVTLGSDTGGSIRQPAAFCGAVGYKPTYGVVSRHGLIAYASSLDQIGPITHTVADTALIMEVIAGADEYDSTSSARAVPEYSKANHSGKVRIAILKNTVDHKGINPEVRAQIEQVIARLREQGHTIAEEEYDLTDYLIPVYYVVSTAEASSNLARFDGVHYGYRSPRATDMDSVYKLSRTEGFGREVKNRIMLGTFVLSAGYYDAYYSRGQKVRRMLCNRLTEIFKSYDFILGPTTPTVPFKFGEKSSDPTEMYLADIYTVLANLAGVPAISLPLAKDSQGLPIGVQLIADRFEDEKLLAFAKTL